MIRKLRCRDCDRLFDAAEQLHAHQDSAHRDGFPRSRYNIGYADDSGYLCEPCGLFVRGYDQALAHRCGGRSSPYPILPAGPAPAEQASEPARATPAADIEWVPILIGLGIVAAFACAVAYAVYRVSFG